MTFLLNLTKISQIALLNKKLWKTQNRKKRVTERESRASQNYIIYTKIVLGRRGCFTKTARKNQRKAVASVEGKSFIFARDKIKSAAKPEVIKGWWERFRVGIEKIA